MYNNHMFDKIFKSLILVFIGFFAILASIYLYIYSDTSQKEISVVGSATEVISNQLAEFTVNFSTENIDKSKAESINNEKVNKFLESLKTFGIEEKNITTTSINSYQKQESSPMPPYTTKLTDWVYSQTISIRLTDVSKVNDLVDLIGKSESSNIYGPNFTVDTNQIDDSSVTTKAFENGREKAEKLAALSGKKIGKVLYISEYETSPIVPFSRSEMVGLGGAVSDKAEVPVGGSEITKSLTITFELK